MLSSRNLYLAAAVVAALAFTGTPAGAQGLFNSWFGNGQRQDSPQPQQQGDWFGGGQQRPPAAIPPQSNAYSDPSNPTDRPVYSPMSQAPPPATGGGHAYCVRTCDGRYFPLARHANANPAQLCSAFCPAAKTMVFNGGQIDYAVAANGTRYSDLEHAFVFRQKIVAGCTCNGKDAFGLAPIDVANDPTLRQGDIVATGDNVKAALIAMAAAKERQPAQDPIAEKLGIRHGTMRRVAGPATAAPAEPEVTPGDERPED